MDNAGIVEFVKQQEEKFAHSDAPDGVFYPILPQQVGRYDVAKRMKGSHSTIEPGMFIAARAPVPQYLPEHWSSLTHPEGALYFCRNSQLRVITSSYLYDRTIADKLMSWVQYLEKRAAEKSFEMTESVELYVQLEDNNCNYYFVDHASRALFWLDDYETSELGLLPVVSPSHLRLQLEEQYWLHLEYYCMHQVPLKTNIIEETISTLTHGYGDQLTSTSSTFPYDAADCKKFLKLLVPQRDRMHDGRVLCIAARLNSVFALNKYWTYYGQEQARLSKDVSMLADEMEEVSWTQPVLSTATFGASRFFHSRLNENFTDSYVYTADWKKMIPSFIGKWKGALHLSLGFLMLHVLCFYLPVSETLAFISAACLSLSMLSSVLLIHSYEDMQNLPCHEAYSFLSGNRLAKFKFQHLALLFALPQALNLWGLLVMFAQLATFVQPFHLASAAAFVVVSVALAKIFQQIRSSSFFSRAKKSDEDRV